MPQRLRLLDFRLSRAASTVGVCQGDIASNADLVNTAQRRLIYDRGAGERGWWGSWQRTVFNVSQTDPFLTLGRDIARLTDVDACKRPIAIQNEFYQFLENGIGLQDPTCSNFRCADTAMHDRGVFPSFLDIVPPNKTIRVFMTDAADVNRRVLIQGLDNQGQVIRSMDGITPVVGEFLTLASPFVQFPLELSKLTGIQKDVTVGPVQFYQVDLTTGAMVLILTMDPSETVAAYRRYAINNLPKNCCQSGLGSTVQLTAMAKLEFIPVVVDTDYLIIQNIEALVSECQAVRFDGMDSPGADQKAVVKHHEAIGFLQGELTHFLGVSRPAVVSAPFGHARLSRRRVGTMI